MQSNQLSSPFLLPPQSMSPTRSRLHRSSARLPHTQDHGQSRRNKHSNSTTQHRQSRSRLSNRSRSPVPHRQSRPKGRGRNTEEGSPNTLTGRELSRALNKASERGTQGKEV
jgi:hypothetical protein